jgi:GNAT superfamily N-acetyltransferase
VAITPALTFLLDTNVVIALEPFAGALEPLRELLAEVVRTARDNGHRVVLHPANRDDLRHTADHLHRVQNLAALDKYTVIAEPDVSDELRASFGSPLPGTNDERDLRLLAAIEAGAATHLITEDSRLQRRAARADLGEQVISGNAALELLRQLHPLDPEPPPSVELTNASMLDLTESIFASLREDYDGFDRWIKKVAREGNGRRTWIIRGDDGRYRAIAIVKVSDDHPLIPGAKATKLCTFKVHSDSEGEKLGELLLKTVLTWAHQVKADNLFVTVLGDEGKQSLIFFLDMFGFQKVGLVPETSEFVYLKEFRSRANEELSALQHHIRFGPPAIRGTSSIFVIPVVPQWYEGLFPDAPSVGSFGQVPLGGLLTETQPFGNALRKAFLSNSNTTELEPGSTILFYRSAGAGGRGAVHAVGVVERTIRSSNPADILAAVGRRTVYTADQVARLCKDDEGRPREVLAILFRQDRFILTPWTLPLLRRRRVLNGAPQTITKVRQEDGIRWVHEQLDA